MIRDIQLKDKEQWEELYKGYADFYKVEMNGSGKWDRTTDLELMSPAQQFFFRLFAS